MTSFEYLSHTTFSPNTHRSLSPWRPNLQITDCCWYYIDTVRECFCNSWQLAEPVPPMEWWFPINNNVKVRTSITCILKWFFYWGFVFDFLIGWERTKFQIIWLHDKERKSGTGGYCQRWPLDLLSNQYPQLSPWCLPGSYCFLPGEAQSQGEGLCYAIWREGGPALTGFSRIFYHIKGSTVKRYSCLPSLIPLAF